jgi:general secretion pathway protein C
MNGKPSQKQHDRSNGRRASGPVALLALLVFALLSAAEFTRILSAPLPSRPVAREREAARADLASPFSPWIGTAARVRAAQAHVAGMKLAGVRVGADPARDSAVFTLTDGAQRAFSVGQEIAPGVRLAAVNADHVVLDMEGEEHRLMMPDATATALGDARAFAESGLPATAEAGADMGQSETAAWLARVLSRPEESVGDPYGWRVTMPVPAVPARAGLKKGDLILAVNGVGPTAGGSGRALANQEFIQLTVIRTTGERVTIRWSGAT